MYGIRRTASASRRGGVLGRPAGALAQFPRLLGERVHLPPDVVGLQRHYVLDVLGAYQLLREVERTGDVLFGETHCLVGDVLGAPAGGLSLVFERVDGVVGRRHETIDGLSCLLDALFGKCTHFGRNFEAIGDGHCRLPRWHGLPMPVRSCDVDEVVGSCCPKSPVRPRVPAPPRIANRHGRQALQCSRNCEERSQMRIVDIREAAIPLKSSLRNSSIDFSEMTTSVVAVLTDVVCDGKPVAGFAFNSTGRYACGAAMRARFIPRILSADPDALLDDSGQNFDPVKILAVMMQREKSGGHSERSIAIGTIEVAVWDAVAKIAGKPLHRLLAERYN